MAAIFAAARANRARQADSVNNPLSRFDVEHPILEELRQDGRIHEWSFKLAARYREENEQGEGQPGGIATLKAWTPSKE